MKPRLCNYVVGTTTHMQIHVALRQCGWSRRSSRDMSHILVSWVDLLLRRVRVAEYCDRLICQCVCVCVSVCEHISKKAAAIFTNFLHDPWAVARSSSGGVTIRYVLPVLWMILRFYNGPYVRDKTHRNALRQFSKCDNFKMVGGTKLKFLHDVAFIKGLYWNN